MDDPEMRATAGPAGLGAFRWGWTAFVVAATSVPYLLHLLSTPPGSHYTWILPPYPEDALGYRAWSEQAARGSLLFRLKYTALPHAPFLFHPFFLICGWMSALLACDIGVVLWVFKSLGVVLFFAAFFKHVDDLRLSRFQSITASLLVGASSGFGGVFALLGLARPSPALPADLWVVDANTFWSLLWNPLFPYVLALMLFAIRRLDRGTREARTSDLWQSGLATGALVLIHPYSQPVLFALAGVLVVARRRAQALGYLCRYVLPVLPPALYVALVATFHPVASKHAARGLMTSPDLSGSLLGFGLPLLLVAGGLAAGGARLARDHWPTIAWFVLSLAFSYIPVWFQRKLIFGAHVPLCILAGVSVDLILARVPRLRARRWALVTAALVCAPVLAATPAYLMDAEFKEVKANKNGVYFVSDDLMESLNYLRQNSRPDAVVFATPSMSRLIPAFSGNTAVWGHWAMSVDRQARDEWLADLLTRCPGLSDEQCSSAFWGAGIDYILADARLKGWIARNPRAWRAILADADQILANESVVIYRQRGGRPE